MSQDKEREAFEALKDLMHTIHIGFAIKSTQEARARKAIRTLESALEQARAALASQRAVQGEPVAWRYSVQPQVLGPAVTVFSETKDVPDAQPLYASPASREPQWQPIETAPKDGTSVLLFTAEGVIEGYFQYRDWEQCVCEASYDMGHARISCTPTHWMPLPPPPGIHSVVQVSR